MVSAFNVSMTLIRSGSISKKLIRSGSIDNGFECQWKTMPSIHLFLNAIIVSCALAMYFPNE